MWYEDRHANQQGYAIASSDSPEGPFSTVVNATGQTGGKIGDFDLLVDDDGKAFQVRTGNIITQLSDDYLGVQGNATSFEPPKSLHCGCEGPTFFKHGGTYYITLGTGCCACKGGSSIFVFSASAPLGPYTYQSDIATIPGIPSGNASTCAEQRGVNGPPGCVYSWRSQATATFVYGNTTVLLGNQWQTAGSPPGSGPRNRDLLYFAPLSFKEDGSIEQLQYRMNVTV
jgi:beta-xylosidase